MVLFVSKTRACYLVHAGLQLMFSAVSTLQLSLPCLSSPGIKESFRFIIATFFFILCLGAWDSAQVEVKGQQVEVGSTPPSGIKLQPSGLVENAITGRGIQNRVGCLITSL